MSQSPSDPLDEDRAKDLAAAAIDAATKAGADAADAVVLADRSLSTTVRNGAIEEAEQAESTNIGLRVFVGHRSALVQLGSAAGLTDAAERAIAMAKAAPEDKTLGLAPKDQLTAGVGLDLDIYDGSTPTMDELVARSRALEEAMQGVPGVTNSGGASAGASHATRALATSEGFLASYRTSGHRHAGTAIAGAGTRMERDYWGSFRRYQSDLQDVREVGQTAARRAVRRLGGEPLSTRTATIVFEPRAASGFLSHLLSAINGSAVARGASLLAGKLGEAVFPDGITVKDNPQQQRGTASRPFDLEGLENPPLTLVKDGILAAYLLDLQSGRKLGLASNGRAYRGIGNPSPSSTNVSVAGGSGDLESIMAEAGSGLLVNGLIGVGANIVSGNYSRGASGFWFENGEVTHPVNEITIAGNLNDMFRRAHFGDDAPGLFAADAPTVAIEGLTIGGR
ncbi:MAG: TldD/PmbA family protein [Pseudomonadota bacterium]